MPRGNQQQQQQHPQQLPLHAQQHLYTTTHQTQLGQTNTQQAYYDNNTPAGQWAPGTSDQPMVTANSGQHGFIQVPQNLLPFIQQQLYGHPQMQQQQAQQQLQYYMTENNRQQLLVRSDASNVNRNG
jgi:hypothetical protein